jgi:hypothetical protein
MTSPAAPDLGRVVVDPRFRARRIAVRKQAGRRRLRRLLVLVALAAASLSVVVVFESPVLDIDEVAVTGTRGLEPSAVTEAAGVELGSPILLTDFGEAEAAVESLALVESARVSRELPGRVVVDVTERRPTAVVSAGEERVVVDRTGVVLAAGDAAGHPDHLRAEAPFVDVVVPEELESALPGPGGTVPQELLDAVSLAGMVRRDPGADVARVLLEPSLSLDLAGGGTVDLGDGSDLPLKVEAFRTVHARIDRSCLDTVDLQVPTHPVVTRSPAC